MTVIRRKVHSYSAPNSNNASDTESLHLGSTHTSDTESVYNEPSTSRRQGGIIKVLKLDDAISLKCGNLGKRKQRRYLNRSILQTLCEEDETDTYVKLIDEHKSPLARLLEDEVALEIWNEFISKPEEEQEEILNSFKRKDAQNVNHKKNIVEPYLRISSKIRRMIKIKKTLPADLLQKMEENLVDFFKSSPDGVYISTPTTSFERLLLHGVAQYHSLTSLSVITNGVRSVQVCTIKADWSPCNLSFCKFVEQLRR